MLFAETAGFAVSCRYIGSMGILRTSRQLIVTAVFATVGFSLPLCAEDATKELLESLQSATPEEATRIDRNIRAAWSRSGSPAMDLLLRRGREAMEAGETEVAINHFTALTDHAPEFAEGWYALARAYYEAELFGPSLDAIGQALALNPDHYHALFGLGVMFQNFGDNQRAAQAYREVLGLHPHHEEANQALESLKSAGVGREL